MAKHEEMFILRRFNTLNVKTLLYMQSELTHLECELANIEKKDRCSEDLETASYDVSMFNLKQSQGKGKDLQWGKVLEIRQKLKEYSMDIAFFFDLEIQCNEAVPANVIMLNDSDDAVLQPSTLEFRN